MKKTLIFIELFIVFILLYFIQMNFFSWFTISGIKPNTFIIFILIVGLFLGRTMGIAIGIIAGLLLDFFIGKNVRDFINNVRNYWFFRRVLR